MSHGGPGGDNDPSESSSQHLEEEEAAFLDMDDPMNEVVDDGSAPKPADYSDDDGDNGDDGENSEDGDDAQGIPAATKVPERDDSIATFHTPTGKPLHAVAVATDAAGGVVVACAGEDDVVFVLAVDNTGARPARCENTSENADGAAAVATPAVPQPESNAIPLVAAKRLETHTDTVTHVLFSPDGTILASGGMDGVVALWDARGGGFVLKNRLTDLSGEVQSLLWHPSSRVLVAGAADGQAVMWNAMTGQVAQYFGGHRGGVTCAVWANDHKKLVTASADGSVMVFNPKTAEVETTVSKDISPAGAGVSAIATLGTASDLLVVGCEDGTVHLAALSKGKVVQHFPADTHAQCVEQIAVCEVQPFYATCSCDCRVVVVSTQDFTVRARINAGEGLTRCLWVRSLLVVGGMDGDVRVWEGRASTSETRLHFMGHSRLVLALAVAPSIVPLPVVPSSVMPPTTCVYSVADDGSLRVFPLTA